MLMLSYEILLQKAVTYFGLSQGTIEAIALLVLAVLLLNKMVRIALTMVALLCVLMLAYSAYLKLWL